MKLTGIKPSTKLLSLVTGLAIVSLIYDFLIRAGTEPFSGYQLFFGLFTLLLIITGIDARNSRMAPSISLDRVVKHNLSVNVPADVTLHIENISDDLYQFRIADLQPENWEHAPSSKLFTLEPNGTTSLHYQTTPRKRGAFRLEAAQCRVLSAMGFWHVDWHCPLITDTKVYPDFRMLHDLSGLQGSATLSQEGLRKFHKRGSGLDFKQLRDHHPGESMRQVDWRATSRFNKLIAREFQDEKNQSVVMMLDAGQRMMVQDEQLSYFDHALNTLIALSHTVLKNGDELSLLSFGQSTRWLGKVKGVGNISLVLNHFFDLHPKSVASDYLRAASELVQKCPKRSLVILVSCLRDEDFSDLLLAVKLLQKHHLVAVASIEDNLFPALNQADIESHIDAGVWLAAQDLSQRIENNKKALTAEGVICISASAKSITPSTINAYLKVKRAGIL